MLHYKTCTECNYLRALKSKYQQGDQRRTLEIKVPRKRYFIVYQNEFIVFFPPTSPIVNSVHSENQKWALRCRWFGRKVLILPGGGAKRNPAQREWKRYLDVFSPPIFFCSLMPQSPGGPTVGGGVVAVAKSIQIWKIAEAKTLKEREFNGPATLRGGGQTHCFLFVSICLLAVLSHLALDTAQSWTLVRSSQRTKNGAQGTRRYWKDNREWGALQRGQ